MSKTQEALKLALEALDAWKRYYGAHWDEIDERAITAIREALAEQPPCQIGSSCIGGKCSECEISGQDSIAIADALDARYDETDFWECREGAHELRRLHDEVARLKARQAAPQGWKLVPVEMTNAMGLAGQRERKTFGSSLSSVYRAMLAAAPEEKL